jgi:AAA domain-containing protein
METAPPSSVHAMATFTPPGIPGYWGRQLDQEPADLSWLWDGLLAGANVTLLTSQWKSGKTTLLSILLARLKEGGRLADLAVRAAKAIVVSEEPRSLWRRRHQKLDLGHVYFISLPFKGKPSLKEWRGLLDHIGDLHAKHGVDLLTIDTLSTFLPSHSEVSADLMMEAMLPLRSLTQRGLSTLLTHHPAKGEPLAGQAARGTGALASFTDINLEMSWYQKNELGDRRRRILSQSRFEETPRQLVIELNQDGTDYLVHGDFAMDEFTQNWERVRMVLEDAKGKKTRQQLRADWPPDFPCPSDVTLHRWLQRAVAGGLACPVRQRPQSRPLPLLARRPRSRVEERPPVRVPPTDGRKRPLARPDGAAVSVRRRS